MILARNDRIRIGARIFVVIAVRDADHYSVREVRAGAHVQRFFRWNGLWRLGAAGARVDVLRVADAEWSSR